MESPQVDSAPEPTAAAEVGTTAPPPPGTTVSLEVVAPEATATVIEEPPATTLTTDVIGPPRVVTPPPEPVPPEVAVVVPTSTEPVESVPPFRPRLGTREPYNPALGPHRFARQGLTKQLPAVRPKAMLVGVLIAVLFVLTLGVVMWFASGRPSMWR